MQKKRKQAQKRETLKGNDRIADLLERIGALGLYLNTDLDQNDIAKKLTMDIHRVNEILKGLKKLNK